MRVIRRSIYLSKVWMAMVLAGLIFSCKPVPVTHWFPVTPRDHYEKELYKAKLEKTPSGQTWFRVAESVMHDSIYATAPHQERIFLSDSIPAQAFLVKIPEGRKLVIQANRADDDTSSHIFAELYRVSRNGKPRQLDYLRQGSNTLEFTNHDQDTLLLRIQNGLGEQTVVTVLLSTRPTLAFPVAGHGMNDVISVWGAERDGGARSHEGIDIRAKRGTPVVAAQNGFVTQTGINNLGGKVVLVSAFNNPYSYYYAHLDSQFVSAGRRVTVGDTLGLVGNTGNAMTTSPHLHFGIYARGTGAVNPLPFIDDRNERIPGLPQRSRFLGDTVVMGRKTNLFESPSLLAADQIMPLPAQTPLRITGEMARGYRVQLNDGTKGYIPTVPLQRTRNIASN